MDYSISSSSENSLEQKKENRKKLGKTTAIILATVLGLIIAVLAGLGIGRYNVGLLDIVQMIFTKLSGGVIADENAATVVFSIRLPRVLMAVLAGSGLAVAGAAFQSTFSNPLATPDTLGVATGASFGATLGIMLGLPSIGIQMTAFFFGILCVVLVYTISRIEGKSSMIMIILAGIVMSSLFEALVSLMKYVADPQDQLPQITFWLMGSLSGVGFKDLAFGAPFIIIGIAALFAIRWKMNTLSLHEDEARSLGVNVNILRGISIVASTLITASVVSMCGKVGWVGLLIPHISRMLFGNSNTKIIPASIGFGAIFMVIIDTLARSISAAELPISILTAIIGAPVFIILLRKTGGIQS